MRLFRLTTATLLRRKSWVICAFAVGVLPFLLQQISSGTENPALLKPAIAQATWAMALLCAIFWGFFTAAKQGESNARSGVGEYFLTTGVSATRQLFEIWLSIFSFLAPLPLIAAAVACDQEMRSTRQRDFLRCRCKRLAVTNGQARLKRQFWGG